MSFDPEDPKWSAYVLGELDDDARAAIDSELAQSLDAQRFVDELRRTIDLLSSELQAEPCPTMSNEELAPVGPADEEADPKRPLFHTIRPEGHRRMVGRGVILAARPPRCWPGSALAATWWPRANGTSAISSWLGRERANRPRRFAKPRPMAISRSTVRR